MSNHLNSKIVLYLFLEYSCSYKMHGEMFRGCLLLIFKLFRKNNSIHMYLEWNNKINVANVIN